MCTEHVCEQCKYGWTDRDDDRKVDSGGRKEPCIRRGLQGGGAIFRGCPAHWKALPITAALVYAAKISAWLLQRTTLPPTGPVSRYLPRVKNPPAMRPLVEILWPLKDRKIMVMQWCLTWRERVDVVAVRMRTMLATPSWAPSVLNCSRALRRAPTKSTAPLPPGW